ncbi:hypothetical protein [Methanosarcina lacustris]|uniref:hypothetical protein n=1 Tax=Methanosarcina lacustris TaxID=170861 RepID=UPI0012F64210|nr:hypothetical protein [Methanosarcina lacustris]
MIPKYTSHHQQEKSEQKAALQAKYPEQASVYARNYLKNTLLQFDLQLQKTA